MIFHSRLPHMKPISLLFHGLDEPEIHRHLHAPSSGFEVDSRQPLRSGLGDASAVIGVVLNAAQLALTIYQIKLAKKEPPSGMDVRIEIERPDGTITRLEGKNVQEIEACLE